MVEVVAALIWDNDKFMVANGLSIRQEHCCGSSLVAKSSLVKLKIRPLSANVRKSLLSHFPLVMCLWT